jgi:hypothetical protein
MRLLCTLSTHGHIAESRCGLIVRGKLSLSLSLSTHDCSGVEFYQPPRVLLLSHSEISHRIVVEAFHIVDLLSHTHTEHRRTHGSCQCVFSIASILLSHI